MARRILLLLAGLAALGYLGFRTWRGPDPEVILARIDVPASPSLEPQDELATFRTPPGFRVELVAAEPLVVDPVAMDWDDEGRLYVVEMRGFMGDLDGSLEDRPVGRVVVLEDTDGDGTMDESRVFLDGLVMPRAIAVLPQGVLVGAPPDLWLCRDPQKTGRCADKTRLADYALTGDNPEHQENGLLAGVDGWIYNAKSERRFRFTEDGFEISRTPLRGQWGLAQDDQGNLYYNHNSAFLYVDAFPADYTIRQAATRETTTKAGVGVALSSGTEVHGVRVAPGLNRAYLRDTLRSDGRQLGPSGVSGLAIQRGHQFGPNFIGDAFVPEAAGAVVAHFSIRRDGNLFSSEHRLYPDPDFGKREFLASTDERFRPVDAKVGPDGALWILDMYRGVIQHAAFVSPHLRAYAKRYGLEAPGETGRIWRIVREDRPIDYAAPPIGTAADQLLALEHPNGWVRDRAQRRLAETPSRATIARLKNLGNFSPLARQHALWALAQGGVLELPTWRDGLDDPSPDVRVTALRAGEEFLRNPVAADIISLEAMLDDPNERVRLQALHSLGTLPAHLRPLDTLLAAGREADPLVAQAARSSLGGLEFDALERELRHEEQFADDANSLRWLRELAEATHAAARESGDRDTATIHLLDMVESTDTELRQIALIEGIANAQRLPRSRRVELAERHALFREGHPAQKDLASAIRSIRSQFTWPGDPRPGGARALRPEELKKFEEGRRLYADTCASCHGPAGQGIRDQGPPLAGSGWVRDSDEWLVRIVVGGLTGPVEVNGVVWNLNMPAHADPKVLDDAQIAAILTFLRRAWGHAEEPVLETTVAKIRASTRNRRLPWTAAELEEIEGPHRFDAYVGVYRVPIAGIELEVTRKGRELQLGTPNGPRGALREVSDDLFGGSGVMLVFERDATGSIESASIDYGNMRVPLSQID